MSLKWFLIPKLTNRLHTALLNIAYVENCLKNPKASSDYFNMETYKTKNDLHNKYSMNKNCPQTST